MRIVYVAGFFGHVFEELQSKVGTNLQDRSVVWIPQYKHVGPDLHWLKSDFLQAVARGATEVLICLYAYRERLRDTLDYLQEAIDCAKSRSPELKVTIKTWKNAFDAEWVLSKIEDFKPSVYACITFPTAFDNLEEWAIAFHNGRIFIHPRAVQAVKKSQYENVQLAYAAVNLLGEEYWRMRTSTPDRSSECRTAFNAKLRDLGLDLAPSITSSRSGEQGEEYLVAYPVGTENKRLLDLHLKKGSSREPRFCLRVYFFWDHDEQKVVIGCLPSHLGTRAT